MLTKITFFLLIFPLLAFQSIHATSLAEEFQIAGYVEICNQKPPQASFDSLYALFDELIYFFETNPTWKKKLYSAKERFIRSKDRNYYSTDFFGFYDESEREGRNQISFYYSVHYHEFICSYFPEMTQVPEIISFLEACLKIQKPYRNLFSKVAVELGLETFFSSIDNQPQVLLKVVKYLPNYAATEPHYDGTLLSLFLDSTDNKSLLLSPYKSSYTTSDFSSPLRLLCREDNQASILLIPGVLLAEFSIYPTPHIVVQNGKTRYATIAFAMRPNYTPQKIELSPLPGF